MRIDQILPSFSAHDGVGTDTLHIQDLLRRRGYTSDIFSLTTTNSRLTRRLEDYFSLPDKKALIYHFSIGSEVPYYLWEVPAFKIIRYHNITPEHFFAGDFFPEAYHRCLEGRSQIGFINAMSHLICSDSHFNASDFEQIGTRPSLVMPIVRHYESLLELAPCFTTTSALRAVKGTKILFVGRGVPNKSPQDLLLYLKLCRDFVDPKAKLWYVGGYHSGFCETRLQHLAQELGISVSYLPKNEADYEKDVHFAGGVSDSALAAYYRSADLFLSLSDHEGFGVPLVEAMTFGLPVIAHKAPGVSETLQDGGVLIDKRQPVQAMEALKRVVQSDAERDKLKALALKRAQDYSWATIEGHFDRFLKEITQLVAVDNQFK